MGVETAKVWTVIMTVTVDMTMTVSMDVTVQVDTKALE